MERLRIKTQSFFFADFYWIFELSYN